MVKEGVLWRRSRTIGAQQDGGMLTLEGLLGLDDMEVDSYLNNINNNDLILKLINVYVYVVLYIKWELEMWCSITHAVCNINNNNNSNGFFDCFMQVFSYLSRNVLCLLFSFRIIINNILIELIKIVIVFYLCI